MIIMFGKKTETQNVLGIYIGSANICIAQINMSKEGKIEIEHLIKLPTNFEPKEKIVKPLALNSEFFNEKAAWVDILKQSVKKVNWNTNKVVVTLSTQFGILRYFVMPYIDKRYWSKSIPLESKKYIPVAFEEVSYDFIINPFDGGKKLGVFFGLTQRKCLEFLIELLKSINFELISVEISVASFERLFGFLDMKEHGSRGYIHFDGNLSFVLFSNNGYPVLYKEVDFESGSTLSGRKTLDIKGAIEFVGRYVGAQSYKQIMISGDNLEVWKSLAEKESPIPVEVWEPSKLMNTKNIELSSYFAVGAALKTRIKNHLTLDISGISSALKTEKQVQSNIWALTFVFGGILLFLSMINHLQIYLVSSKLNKFRFMIQDIPEFQQQSPDSVKNIMERMKKKVRTLSVFFDKPDYMAPKLQVIADTIPRELWIIDMIYTNPVGESENKTLKITGETMLSGDPKFKEVDSYYKALKSSKEFEIFVKPPGIMEMNLGSVSGAGKGGGTGKASNFIILCEVKKKN